MESTARAERLDVASSTSASYLWVVPQKPVAVKLSHSLINRLEQDTVEAFRSLTSRGSEVGGILLGVSTPGNPVTVTVDNYELIECDYSRGPLFRLSDADTGRFARAIEKYGASRVMGYFRSHTRKGLALDAEDLAFFDAHFREAHNLILLVRPFATKASTAGIFIRENGKIAGDASLLEFPFRVSELGGPAASRTESAPALASAAPAISVPPLEPPAPKAVPRAQIVPIAPPRRDTTPEIKPTPSVSVAVAPAITPQEVVKPKESVKPEPPKPETAKVKEPEPVKETVTPKVAPKAEPAVQEKETSSAAPVAVEETPIPPSLAGNTDAEESQGSKKVRVLLIAAALMIVLVGGGLFLAPTLLHRGAKTTAPTQDASALQLRVERTSGGLLLTWNRDAQVIRNASRVVLIVGDGDRKENIEMDPNQVRTGSILYPPISQDVSFQMEVTDSKSAKTSSESLRVFDPRPSPLAAPGTPAVPAASGAAQPAATKPVTGTKPDDVTGVTPPATSATTPDAPAPAKPSTPSKQFNGDSLASRLRQATSNDQPLPDAPTVTRNNSVNAGGLNAIVPGASPLAPPPASPAESAPKSVPNAGGKIVPAEPTFKKAPEYPKIARQTGASGIVEVEAIIGADGRVKDAKVSKGNPMLQKAAIDAVKEWRYKPAMLNGIAVESPVQIKLNFVPDR